MAEADRMVVRIPTLGRVTEQKTLAQLPRRWLERTKLAPPEGEAKYFAEDKVQAVPVEGIAPTRQWLLENAGSRYVCMLDDDMRFYRRRGDEGRKLRRATPEDVGEMLDVLERWLREEQLAAVGVSAQQINWYTEEPWAEGTRMNNAYAFDVERTAELGVRFDRLRLMEDFDVTLQLLKAGEKNRVSYEWAWDQKASNAPGGCSLYRDREMQGEAARGLKERHPECVSVVEKEAKSGWPGMKVRTDVRIQWQKAVEIGEQRRREQEREPAKRGGAG